MGRTKAALKMSLILRNAWIDVLLYSDHFMVITPKTKPLKR